MGLESGNGDIERVLKSLKTLQEEVPLIGFDFKNKLMESVNAHKSLNPIGSSKGPGSSKSSGSRGSNRKRNKMVGGGGGVHGERGWTAFLKIDQYWKCGSIIFILFTGLFFFLSPAILFPKSTKKFSYTRLLILVSVITVVLILIIYSMVSHHRRS